MSSLATCWICVGTDCDFGLHDNSRIYGYICEGLINACWNKKNVYTRPTSPYKIRLCHIAYEKSFGGSRQFIIKSIVTIYVHLLPPHHEYNVISASILKDIIYIVSDHMWGCMVWVGHWDLSSEDSAALRINWLHYNKSHFFKGHEDMQWLHVRDTTELL